MASTAVRPAFERSCTELLSAFRPRVAHRHHMRCFASRSSTASLQRQAPFLAAGKGQRFLSTTGSLSAQPSDPSTAPTSSSPATSQKAVNLKDGLGDAPVDLEQSDEGQDWTRSFHGLSSQPFSKEAADILTASLPMEDIEIKPDGIIYLPEIKYRRILNKAFGPGGWGLAPRGESIVTPKAVTREYALVAHGRLVSIARGEQDYFSPEGIPTASEGCKSNAMMRCCKDLGVASELWDPRFIRKFKTQQTRQAFVEHSVTKKKTAIWLRKGDPVPYPWKESTGQRQS